MIELIGSIPLKPNPTAIARRFKTPPETMITPWTNLLSLAGEWSRKAMALVEPSGILALAEVVIPSPGTIRFTYIEKGLKASADDRGLEVTSFLVADKFTGCSEAAIWVVTLGIRLDEAMKKAAAKGEFLLMAGLDAAGSELADDAAAFVAGIVKRRAAARGLVPTARISPGYGDFPMDFHRGMNDFLVFKRIGVSVVDGSFSLVPGKSVTALAGLRGSPLRNRKIS